MWDEQYVCTVCGFNMVGYHPSHCPFCGAQAAKFLTWQECSARHHVEGTPITAKVTRLNSVPSLGLEHAAYRVETSAKTFWIDCPSSFDQRLTPADVLLFTHHHFLGASNQYRKFFEAQVWIHTLDAAHDICRAFTFDTTFDRNFTEDGIEAWHIGGHPPGFNLYFFENCLFMCDYVFLHQGGMQYNPFGPAGETIAGGSRIREILKNRHLTWVCGYNYVVPYAAWQEKFDQMPLAEGY
jgi:hypothetical protein